MSNVTHDILSIALISVITFLLRAIPFFLFSNKKTPAYIVYLGRFLPYAIIGMLVVYCLKEVKILAYPYGIPEVLAGGLVFLLHIYKKNILLSIGVGTISYMALVQYVF